MFKLLGLLPIPVFVVITLTLTLQGTREVFEPFLLHPVLNTMLLGIASLLSAYISARSYLINGSYTLLLLGGGAFVYGSSMPLCNWLMYPPGGANVAVTVGNVGSLVASALFFASATLALAGVPLQSSNPRRSTAVVVYLGLLIFDASLAIAALQGVIPTFFIPGIGPTMLRQEVLGSTMILFALSSILFMRLCFKSKAEILYWFSLALALIVIGFSAWLLQHAVGDPLSWTGRSAQYLGAIYFLIGSLTTGKARHAQ
jgi:hypothetical protein